MTSRGLENGFIQGHQATESVTGCVGDLFAGLILEDGLPQLRNLAELLVGNCQSIVPEASLAVVMPSNGASLLEPGLVQEPNNCLRLSSGSNTPQWGSLAEEWSHGKTMGVTGGFGCGPWPEQDHPVSNCGRMNWQEMTATIQGQPAFIALIVFPARKELAVEIEAGLRRLLFALNPLLQVWASARDKDAQCKRLHSENQALARLNSLQEKIVSLTSHEFKTPLTSITAYTDALRTQLTNADFPHATEFLNVIHTESGRLLRLANRMVDFSGMASPLDFLEVQAQPVAPLVQDAVQTLRPALAAKDQHLELDFAQGIPGARIDADLIRQVVINLLSNATKYTPEGGHISIHLEERESAVRLTVADTGLGIPENDLQRVFREFYRTEGKAKKEEGTGLGLTIVRNIMNLHEGYVGVKRRQVQGTLFFCDLPKEVREMAPLPLEFSSRTDREKSWSLVRNLLYTAAELSGSKGVELALRDGHGGMATVAVMGPKRQDNEREAWLESPLMAGDELMGHLWVGCPLGESAYDERQQAQLAVIADLGALALGYLTPHSPDSGEESVNDQVSKVIAAIGAVLRTRRSGITTSCPLSLDLLGKTATLLNVGSENIRRLQFAALLHDAGMTKVESEIVMGETVLSWDQKDEVEKHVDQGADMVAPLLLDPDLSRVIRHHHEWFDGNGYPENLRGREIPLGSRLLAVVDAWFALTRERTFRPQLSATAALKEIQNHTGTQFDPQVVSAFADVLAAEGVVNGVPA